MQGVARVEVQVGIEPGSLGEDVVGDWVENEVWVGSGSL